MLELLLHPRFYSSHLERKAIHREGTESNLGIDGLQFHRGSYFREAGRDEESHALSLESLRQV